ncbi:MAG: hypothetical protein GX550_09280 [Syntrophomonadaceae bacterium]|nr:hypothetical protein [Syntrophomonadaceae bacterium]
MDFVVFNKCIQDLQELGTDEFMTSRLFFDLEVKGKKYENQECTIKQTVGSNFEGDSSFEVYVDFPKVWGVDYEKFQSAAKSYFRGLVGSSGTGIRVMNSHSTRMYNNTFAVKRRYDL